MHTLAGIVYCLTVSITASSVLDILDIRLANGTGPYGGRVEVSMNGIWGTICDDSFDMDDATVICRMMNLKAVTFVTGAWFGQGIGPIYAQELKCSGHESHLKDCSFVSNVQCTHARDVGVMCSECWKIEISNGNMVDISANGTVLSTQCNNGFTSDVTTSSCINGKWSPPSIICKYDISDIRLVNGIGLYDGRIELFVNGTWGTICSTSFSGSEAKAICNILFDTTSIRKYKTNSNLYGQGTGPIHIDRLDCDGSETNINECSYSLDVSCTSHSKDAAVACNVQPLNITGTRLVNGTGPYDGRIELYVDGHWGTVCNRYIEMYDARTICNTHNASLAAYFSTLIYGEGSGPVLVDNIHCTSNQNHVKDCSVYSPYRTHCTHDYDLSIACTPCGLPKIYNGVPFSFYNTELTVKCQEGFFPDYIKMRCLSNGTWIEDQRCISNNVYPLSISDIRLAGMTTLPSEGRVEFLVNGSWGTVCDTNFKREDATVVCRMLGLEYSSYFVNAGGFGTGTGTIFVDRLNCSGTEKHINNCTYDVSNYCTHYDDVAVRCTGYQLNITNIRLAGTNAPYHGRVELEVNGKWGTVCDNYFNWPDAKVFCRMLGLRYRNNYYDAVYGPGSGPIYLDRLFCYGWESHINECRHAVNNYYNCDHGDDASIMCYGPRLNITDARLANGTGQFDGRAEIKVDDTWGTICDANFNILAADYFCNILGLRAAQFFTGAIYGEGNGPVFIDQLFCKEKDLEFSNCKYLFLNECSHERDISVVCNECGLPDIFHWDAEFFTYNGTTLYADCTYYRTYVGTLKLTCDNETQSWMTEGECQEYSYPLNVTDIRLSGGPRPSSGRVEIRSLDTWGTVCDANFGTAEANVICNMIGFPPAVSYHADAFYGEGKGPIFVDDLSCTEGASELNDCSYKTYDNCTHEDDISVVCTDCGDPTPENGFINSSSTRYETAVHVTCKQDYELVGEADITCQLNGNWSSKPICKLIDCGDKTPEHGSRNTTVTTNGTVVLIQCEEGYNISGEAVIMCQQDGRWTDYPSCEIIDCNIPKPENADVTLVGNKTTFSETAAITCLEGHIPSDTGSTTISCLANGTWEVWSDCIPVDCNNPVPNKGSANTTDTTYGTVVQITCPPGYNISGDSIIFCQADGMWTNTPVCETTDCGPLSLANGEANTTLGTSTGSNATVECNEGYALNGPPFVICATFGWNDSSIACEIQACNDPTPSNGKITSTDGSNGYVFRNYVEIDCNVGYELKGDSVITCEDRAVWSDQPSCVLRDCGNLTAPVDGNMDDSKGTKYSARITFSCSEEFLLVGDKETFCNENGEWTNTVPTCIRKSNIDETCVNDAYCLFEDARCINSLCTCITGIYDETAKKCDIMPLLPYGTSEGDTSVHKGKGCGAKVTFELGFPAFNSMRKEVYICWYGYLSLDSVYANPTPPENKNSLSDIEEWSILSPFNAPINIETSEALYYRSFDIRSSYEKMKNNDELISYIEMIVRKFGNDDSFDASFVLIVTWDKARPLQGFDITKTSTFQAVLTSDGETSYAFYIYGYGKMQWVNNRSSGSQIWVGYIVDKITYSHPYSFNDSVLTLDSKLQVAASENDVSGLVFKPLNQQGRKHKNAGVDCVKWYNNNYEDKKQLDFIASMTPECPCDIWLSRFDPWFWKIGLQRRRTDTIACVDMLNVGIFGHYGKRCCYYLRSWLFVYERPYAGGFQLYHPRFKREHEINDDNPKKQCCFESNYCNLYYDLRPTGSCYKTSPYDFGIFWGDPHFRTLDGMNFTFNGLGEYVLLQVRGNKTFDLHARTERPMKEDGNFSEATIFTAFAAKDSTNASLHVELSRDKNGISLNISISVKMLSLNSLVNKTLKGRTQGLLGNYNGNPNDDFTLPNGTVLNANLTEKEVFEYGKTWEIHADNSAFIYDKGKSHFDYHNESYIPRFLDEADSIKVSEAINVCNGSQNSQCVFDLVFTEKPEVALNTRDIKLDSDAIRSQLDESIPSLIGCDMINANKGEHVTCNFIADDNDSVYFLENSVNATIDREFSRVDYVQENEDPVNIRIASRNKDGRSSTTVILEVLLCTNCNNHGQCTNVSRGDDRENEYFRIASCECEPEYEGPDCENEYNGCAANPCSLNRTCITLSAKDQKLLGRSYNCSACPDGYTVDSQDITQCSDIDECVEDTDNCQHTCINTEGSFECSCNAGYRTDSKDAHKCRDVNECDDELHNCTQICNNTEGSFTCQCFAGYNIDTETGSCAQIGDGQCNDAQTDACSDTGGCTLDNEIPVCFCSYGYETDVTGKRCEDIDECSRGLCPHDCVNRDGGFECVCYPGYRLEGRTTCTECDVLHWGENCTRDCVCTGRGAERCDNVKGCVCDDGWQGDTCNEDINECNLPIQMCDDSRKGCFNNLGSYSCECKAGFSETEQGACEDIDECSDLLLNKCSQICENTFGSYSCKCNTGYMKENETACSDIDECELGLSHCEQICVNDPGQYSCSCNFGYILNDNRQDCIYLSNPCFELSNLTCSHFCLAEKDSAECSCRAGYRLEADNQTCTDINECENTNENQCDTAANCTNTDGSFLCECPVGMHIENDGRTCSECDNYHYGKDCLQECSCLYGACEKKTGCVCNTGWGGRFCDTDIDECDAELLVCSQENTVCVNTLGSATCSCKSGYANDSGVCTDIDECSDIHLNSCDQVCNNTEGSYLCFCRPGFIQKGKCIDIDECAGSHGCDQVCENTAGSYKCSCDESFALNLSDRKSCNPETECSVEEKSTCPEHSTCFRKTGEVVCTCSKGYQNASASNSCEDINECERDTNQCSDNCSNTDGSFLCSCSIGRYLMEDEVTCRECELWKYGNNCVSDCACNKSNSNLCDREGGQCDCKPGWNGESCDDDIDECNEKTVCPNNSTCTNSIGSFSCKCNDGYFKTGDGTCEECDTRHFGENCLLKCTCNLENTDDCHHETGDCVCKKEWTGDTCTVDVEECEQSPDVCQKKPNSTCKNSQGSYICECETGFYETGGQCEECDTRHFGENCLQECTCNLENADDCHHETGDCVCKKGWTGDTCTVDVEECEQSLDVCQRKPNSTCKNSQGSYICECETGFYETGGQCEACREWAYGFHCESVCTCVTSHTEMCDAITGDCRCKSGWNDTNCENDIDKCSNAEVCPEHSTCENSEGSYDCTCDIGYIETVTGECKYTGQTTRTPVGEIIIDVTVTLGYNLPAGTNLNASSTYKTLGSKCVASLRDFISQFVSRSIQIIVKSIRIGSLIVDYTVVYGTKDATVASQLTEAVILLQQGSYLNFDGQNVSASSDSYKDLGPCGIYQEIIGDCGERYSCRVENDVPVCKLVEESSDVNLSMIIGLAGAGLTLVIATGMLLVCLQRCVRKPRNTPHLTQRSYHNYIFNREFDEVPDFYRIQGRQKGKSEDDRMRVKFV